MCRAVRTLPRGAAPGLRGCLRDFTCAPRRVLHFSSEHRRKIAASFSWTVRMSTRTRRCGLLLWMFVSGTAAAQGLTDSPVILRSGSWDVHRTHDAMSDATVCTGVYDGRYEVQLSD